MLRVLLIHAGLIPHYRVPIYGYLRRYLLDYGIDLLVTADGVQPGYHDTIEFRNIPIRLSAMSISRLVREEKIEVIIDFMELKHRYLFPTYLVTKVILGTKMIYWGQGRDLLDPRNILKNIAYAIEQSMCGAIILYAEHLKKYIPKVFHRKTFIANNTLYMNYQGLPPGKTRAQILAGYRINTQKNIICVGRMQKRKRIVHLVEALRYMNRSDIGLILVGPDTDGILDEYRATNIFKLGPIYGEKKFDLLSSADVCCLPGAVGLSIVDAFHCGLPFVTEWGDESAEIMYLKDGENGFIVSQGDITELSRKLQLLLDDDELRARFSEAARKEVRENGSMDRFSSGFRDAIMYVIQRNAAG